MQAAASFLSDTWGSWFTFKIWGSWVLKVQQSEARSTGFREPSPELLLNIHKSFLFMKCIFIAYSCTLWDIIIFRGDPKSGNSRSPIPRIDAYECKSLVESKSTTAIRGQVIVISKYLNRCSKVTVYALRLFRIVAQMYQGNVWWDRVHKIQNLSSYSFCFRITLDLTLELTISDKRWYPKPKTYSTPLTKDRTLLCYIPLTTENITL